MIALIVGGVLGLGLLGGVVAVVADGDADEVPPRSTTSSSSTSASGTTTGTGTPPDTPDAPEPSSGILDPEPIGTSSPTPEPGEPEPTAPTQAPEPTALPEPEPEPEPGPEAAGDVVVLSATGAQVPVPAGWEVVSDVSGDEVFLRSSSGTYVQAITGTTEPSATAISLINGQLDRVLPDSHYSGVTFDDPITLQPYGSLVSFAGLHYEATWIDSQSTFPVSGTVWCAVRQDGTVLIMTPEQRSRQDLINEAEDWGRVVDGAFNLLGGL